MSIAAGGTLGASGSELSLANCAWEPGAATPSARMRSAIGSTAFHSQCR
jgi:hypothetical protein